MREIFSVRTGIGFAEQIYDLINPLKILVIDSIRRDIEDAYRSAKRQLSRSHRVQAKFHSKCSMRMLSFIP
jgi:hypothetical protein